MSNQAEDFACKLLRVSCLYGLAMKSPEVFFDIYYAEIFWWRKSVDSKDLELDETGKTLDSQKCKLQRRYGKVWGTGSKFSHFFIWPNEGRELIKFLPMNRPSDYKSGSRRDIQGNKGKGLRDCKLDYSIYKIDTLN